MLVAIARVFELGPALKKGENEAVGFAAHIASGRYTTYEGGMKMKAENAWRLSVPPFGYPSAAHASRRCDNGRLKIWRLFECDMTRILVFGPAPHSTVVRFLPRRVSPPNLYVAQCRQNGEAKSV
jgi:hypothetical protein